MTKQKFWIVLYLLNKFNLLVKNLRRKKTSVPNGFMGEFFHTFKAEITPILHKFFQRVEKEETLSNSFYKTSDTWIPKTEKKKP